MATFRVAKKNNYTVMSNYHLKDFSLSLKAKGLLSYMLSLPDDWDYTTKGLAKMCKEGYDAINNALKELEDCRYLKRERVRQQNGQFKYDYQVFEEPYPNNPLPVERVSENHEQINTNILNTNKQIDKIDKTIHPITNELIKRKFIDEYDLDLYKYNNLFEELLLKYDYMNIIVKCNYILSNWKSNNGHDENYNEITNKFGYFKSSLENNLERDNIEIDWLDENIE